MKLPQLETCCFVFDLKTGNIILGCLNAVITFTLVVIMIVAAVVAGVEKTDKDQDPFVDVEVKAGLTGLYAMCIILVLMFTAKFLFDIAFVYGVITERAGIIKAYIIMWIVFFLLHMFIFFLNVPSFNAGIICTELFYIGINIYLILLIRSFYKVLNNREEV